MLDLKSQRELQSVKNEAQQALNTVEREAQHEFRMLTIKTQLELRMFEIDSQRLKGALRLWRTAAHELKTTTKRW